MRQSAVEKLSQELTQWFNSKNDDGHVPFSDQFSWWRSKAIELQEQVDDDARHLLQNLLAVIHGDGGHYVVQHGLKKAAIDGEAKVIEARHEIERLRDLLKETLTCGVPWNKIRDYLKGQP